MNSFLSMERVCQIKKPYTFQIISHGGQSTISTRNLFKVPKEITISSDMHILQEYGKPSSTTFAFLRGQGWGFATYVLLSNKEWIERGTSLKKLFS